MSTDRDTTRIVRSWLEEGATALPDRVLDAVLDQLPATSQRRAWWPAWRFREMNNALKLAIAAAAVVVVAVVGFSLVPDRAASVAPRQARPRIGRRLADAGAITERELVRQPRRRVRSWDALFHR